MANVGNYLSTDARNPDLFTGASERSWSWRELNRGRGLDSKEEKNLGKYIS